MSFVLLYRCRLTSNNTVEEIGAFYNPTSKYKFVRYRYKFNNILMCPLLRSFSFLPFHVVIFIKALKNCTWSILKLSIISLHLLISYYFLTQLWICSYCIRLSGDIELNPGPKRDINQRFAVCHWNLNSVASYNFSKTQSLIAYNSIHKLTLFASLNPT